ncbi:MAG: tetratricopeptide repeat protein [bacterium]|nr:tetratricopeptide repeat protein [bacterium]
MEPIQNLEELGVNNSKIDKVSLILFVLSIIALVVTVTFYKNISNDLLKSTVFALGAVLTIIPWSINKLFKKTLNIPLNTITYSLFGIIVISLISVFVSGDINKSIFGYGVETITGGFIWILSIFVILASSILSNKKSLSVVYKTLGILSIIFIIFNFVSIFWGVFGKVINFAGLWSDAGIILATIILVSAILIQFTNLSLWKKIFLYVLIAVSLVTEFIISVQFSSIWWVMSAFSLLLIIVSCIDFKRGNGREDTAFASRSLIPYTLIIIFVLSLLPVIIPLSQITKIKFLPFSVNYVDQFSSNIAITSSVGQSAIKADPVFGPGPNMYLEVYKANRPKEANNSIIWSVDYWYGFGTIPTLMISTGILGILAWLIFIISFAIRSLKTVFSDIDRGEKNLYSFLSAILALFFGTMLFIHVSGIMLIGITALFVSAYIGSLVQMGRVKIVTLGENSKFSITTPIIVSLLILGSLFYLYRQSTILLASSKFDKANILLAEKQDFAGTEELILEAANSTNFDLYYRSLVDLKLIQAGNILNSTNKLEKEEDKKAFTDVFQSAVNYAKKALELSPNDYNNYLYFAKMAETSYTLGQKDSYEQAKASYTKALSMYPNNPSIVLSLARLEGMAGNIDEAEKIVLFALNIKPNYFDAAVFLAQIYEQKKDVPKMIEVTTYIVKMIAPQESVEWYYKLGFLLYTDGKFSDSAQVLGRAIQITPEYANARYFYGLDLARLGKFQEAIEQFKIIRQTNPEIKELDQIISDLELGKQPKLDQKTSAPVTADSSKKVTAPTKSTVTTKKNSGTTTKKK